LAPAPGARSAPVGFGVVSAADDPATVRSVSM
jgi:hypothetical protein